MNNEKVFSEIREKLSGLKLKKGDFFVFCGVSSGIANTNCSVSYREFLRIQKHVAEQLIKNNPEFKNGVKKK